MGSARRIAVVGAGAVGGYIGGHLAHHGEDVTLIDGWPAHVEHLKLHGIDLRGTTPEEHVNVPVRAMHVGEVQSLAREAAIDIAFVSTKSYDTAWATELIRPYLSPAGFVVSLQNGINEDVIGRIVGRDRTLGCVASLICVELFEPGHVRRVVPLGGERHTVFRVGEAGEGRSMQRAEEVARLLATADSAKVTTNLSGERWSKLAINCMRNAMSAATGVVGSRGDLDDAQRRLSIRLAGEVVRIGLALGHDVVDMYGVRARLFAMAVEGDAAALHELDEILLARIERAQLGAEHRASMGQDVLKGRRTEIDQLNGLVCTKGAELGIPTPANEALCNIVKRIERGELEPRPENIAHLV